MSERTSDDLDSAPPDPDALFEILAHERRRHALRRLRTREGAVALADLADEVARLERDAESGVEVPRENVERIRADLYHRHVPKMADAGVVDYDRESDVVRLACDLSAVDLQDTL